MADTDHKKIAGQIALSNQERQWSFTPDLSWKAGRYHIVADSVVEDLAGNSLGKPFEVDVFERIQEKPSEETVTLPFEVGSH